MLIVGARWSRSTFVYRSVLWPWVLASWETRRLGPLGRVLRWALGDWAVRPCPWAEQWAVEHLGLRAATVLRVVWVDRVPSFNTRLGLYLIRVFSSVTRCSYLGNGYWAIRVRVFRVQGFGLGFYAQCYLTLCHASMLNRVVVAAARCTSTNPH
jgi:hypothetical protein